MKPAEVVRNLTPSSTAELSLAAAVAGVAVGAQIEHGHPEPPAAAVVNDHENGVIVFPAASRAPETVAV
jgi:hypothetical protein